MRSLDAYRHNLPVQLTPLVGRRREIAELRGLLGGERLVTLIGSAGVGKTRLALALSLPMLVEIRPAGVWWVELAPLSDPGAVGRAALAALGAREDCPASPLPSQLAIELGDEPSLLVLDNCEHLIAACAEFVADLLAGNPSRVGVGNEPRTARCARRGRLAGAVAALPGAGANRVDVPALSQYDAVVLFLGRAHRARPSFTVSDAQRSRRRPDLSPARRHPAGHRAGRGPLPADVGGANRRRTR